MKTQWQYFNGTWVIFVLDTKNLIPEWRPAGYVIQRQVYENLAPTWYAYEILEDERGGILVRQGEPDCLEAQRALFASVTGTGPA